MIYITDLLFQAYTLMLFARILGSWIPEFQNSRIMSFIAFYTDPYLNFFRKFIPPLGMMDFSPVIAFICLSIMRQMIYSILV